MATVLPGVYFDEINTIPVGDTEGIKIPIFIGGSDNTGDATNIHKFEKLDDAVTALSSAKGGALLKAITEFFEENEPVNTDDKTVPYIYAIDMGKISETEKWENAMEKAKSKSDITMEVFCGLPSESVATLIATAITSINTQVRLGNIRTVFFTVENATDSALITLGATSTIQDSRVGLVEPLLFGKTIARICLTPFYEEAGFNVYRSVEAGTFLERTRTEENALQDGGIIFNHDEKVLEDIYPKINKTVSLAYAKTEKPNDALFHARFNVDNLMREIFAIEYPQIKANETVESISRLQSKVDSLIETQIGNGYMNEGTVCVISESTVDPYDILNEITAIPINFTNAIVNNVYIGEAVMVVTE